MDQIKNPGLASLKARQARQAPLIKTVTVSAPRKALSIAKPRPALSTASSATIYKVKPPTTNGHAPRVTKIARPAKASQPAVRESHDPVKLVTRKHKSASPAISTPRFTDSDDGSDGEDPEQEQASKRRRLNAGSNIDPERSIRDVEAFSATSQATFTMVHSADVANSSTMEHNKNKYNTFFTALKEEEEDSPVIQFRYPSACPPEGYQLVRPTDNSDFKPLDEIMANMKIVAKYFLGYQDEKKIFNEDDESSGLYADLLRAAKRGLRGYAGSQQEFINVIDKYNSILDELLKNGSIAKNLDEMESIPLPLVEHIVKNQVYARTVSPQVHLVTKYESFSDNVYGELLPPFLNLIFKQTNLKSHQVFVDLGSGVGNCVLQAALEIGCESWGCEVMENPCKLARLQAAEFPARCRLWGLKPGEVHLVQGSFLNNPEMDKVLRRADVVLINNYAFTPKLNEALKLKFLDLKEGCQIVSLKPFADPDHQIKATNIEDPVNILEVTKHPRYSGHVSWGSDPGNWFIHRKDSSRVEKFLNNSRSRR